MLKDILRALACGNNVIAVGLGSGVIIILDAITSNKIATLSEHTTCICALSFSSDGTLLASGGHDDIIKVWEMQTGGVINTFHGHADSVFSVSISADCTKVVSGSDDKTVRLWDIQTGECYFVKELEGPVRSVSFSPTDPRHFVCASDTCIQQWDIDGYKAGPTDDGSWVAFSPDSTWLAICCDKTVVVQNSTSYRIVAIFKTPNHSAQCCFSPDSKLIAAISDNIVYVWDIACSKPHLVGTFGNPSSHLVFSSPSSLVLASRRDFIQFWQVRGFTQDLAISGPNPSLPTPAPIRFVSLQVEYGIAISCDLAGIVKTWNIITGLCEETFETPAAGTGSRAVLLVDDRLMVSWYKFGIWFWDSETCRNAQVLDKRKGVIPKFSGNGSKIFLLGNDGIKVISTQTLQLIHQLDFEQKMEYYLDPLYVNDSKVWIRLKDFSIQGWDFETSPPSIPPSHISSERPHLDFIGFGLLMMCWSLLGVPLCGSGTIKNIITGKTVFCLSGKYIIVNSIQWDGRYLVTGHENGEILILDFNCLGSQ